MISAASTAAASPGMGSAGARRRSAFRYDRRHCSRRAIHGERIEYQVEVDGQGLMMIYGERHKPVDEGGQVWLKLRPDSHSAWSHKEE
jgi:biotin carboxylase